MADPMTPIEVVETYFKAVRAQDLDLLRSIFADDMVLISINAGHLSGGENIVEFYGKFLEKHGGADPHPGPLMQFGNVVAFEVDAFTVAPEVGGVLVVGLTLTQVAEPVIESLSVGFAAGVRSPESPLTYGAGGIACGLEQAGQSRCSFGQRQLPLAVIVAPAADLEIAAHVRMAAVHACHQDAACRSADGSARVVLLEQHPFGG